MAVVNGEQITRQALADQCVLRYGEEVLESMLNKYLILEACRTRGIVVTEQQVEQEIQRLAGKFGLSTERWLQMLQAERNIAPDKYRNDIVWPTLALRKIAADDLEIPPEDVERMLESELGPRVQARMISVSDLQTAKQVHALASANPESFAKLAQEHSEDTTSKSIGGLIPLIRRHAGDPTVENVVFALEEGEISRIISVANQHLILKCERIIPPTELSPAQQDAARARIIEHLREKKLRSVASDLFRQMQEAARVQNVLNNPQLRQQMPGIAATVNGTPIPIRDLAEECIVRHGHEVLDGEINRQLLRQELARAGRTVEKADIDREIARAAESFGYLTPAGQPDVPRWLQHVVEQDGGTVDLYVRDAVWPSVALKKLVGSQVQVTNEDLKKSFEANYGPRVQVLAIVLDNQRQANKVWNMAKANETEQFFGKLAEQYSTEPVSAANKGRVPPIQRHSGRPTIEKAAFELKPGKISGLINAGNKWVILFCLGRTKQIVTEMDETIRTELFKDIHEKKLRLEMAKKFDEIKETAQIDNFLAGTSQSGRRDRQADATGKIEHRMVPFGRQ